MSGYIQVDITSEKEFQLLNTLVDVFRQMPLEARRRTFAYLLDRFPVPANVTKPHGYKGGGAWVETPLGVSLYDAPPGPDATRTDSVSSDVEQPDVK